MNCALLDEDLVRDALAGDESAFSALYDRYRFAIFSTVYRIIQDSDEAQDATQEIFIKVYRSLRSYDPLQSKFSTWLYRLATNHAIDCWRGRRRRAEFQTAEFGTEQYSGVLETDTYPFQQVGNKEEVGQIQKCVMMLPELQKKVFVLRYFMEMKLEEIAAVEKCSLGTVKTSLFRATRYVRQSLLKFRGAP
jgi:RNA polymerase sigma-70 factor (ECF subfamily)